MISFGIYPCRGCGIVNPFRNIPEIIVPQLITVLRAKAPPAAVEQYKEVLALLDNVSQYSVYAAPSVALCCFVFALYLTGRRYCRHKKYRNYTLYMDDDIECNEMEKKHDDEVEFAWNT